MSRGQWQKKKKFLIEVGRLNFYFLPYIFLFFRIFFFQPYNFFFFRKLRGGPPFPLSLPVLYLMSIGTVLILFGRN
jgi:hypothetical protein